jgi:hypothetical protein
MKKDKLFPVLRVASVCSTLELNAARLVATLNTPSSPCAASVPNIVSTYPKNNFVSTKYKSNPKDISKQATTRNNNQVIYPPPLMDQKANRMYSVLFHVQ